MERGLRAPLSAHERSASALSLLAFRSSLLFGAIYKVLPDKRFEWHDVMIGAEFTKVYAHHYGSRVRQRPRNGASDRRPGP